MLVRKRLLIVLVLALLAATAAGTASWLWPGISRLWQKPGRPCNLIQIGLAMIQYAGDHEDRFPKSFGVLFKERYLTTAQCFIEPNSGSRVPADFPRDIESFQKADIAVFDRVHDFGDYVMVKGLTHAADADAIVLYEKRCIYDKTRGCFFNDGHREWLPEAEFQKRINEQWSKLHELSLLRPEGDDVRMACMSRIRKIGIALISYAGDHGGRLPESWGTLLQAGYLVYPASLLCPAAGHTALPDFPKDAKNAEPAVLRKADAFSDYVLVKGVTHNDDADLIIVHEKRPFVGNGRCCLFNDGHVEYLPEVEFQKRMKAQEAKLREMSKKEIK